MYPYRTELKAPGVLSKLDFANPKLAPMVQLMVRNLQQSVRSFQPPQGVCVRTIQVQTQEGATYDCFVVEPNTAETLPGMLYCHGGGFFLPLQPMMLQLAAQFASTMQLRVFLPDYRLLPQAQHQAAFADCLAAWQIMTQQEEQLHVDTSILLLYGESAGGALAAGLALYLRDHAKLQPCGQLLVYPVLDSRSERYASMQAYPHAAWPRKSNECLWQSYLTDAPQANLPYLVPLQNDNFFNLPPTYIEPQEIDILCDEAICYANALQASGVPVELNKIAGSYHGFDSDVENPFVQIVVAARMLAMQRMLTPEEQ